MRGRRTNNATHLSLDEARAAWQSGDWRTLEPMIRSVAANAAYRFTYRGGAIDGDAVDDIVQTVLVKCWQFREVPVNPFTWINVVALNVAKDYAKSYSVSHREDASALDAVIAPEPDVDTTARALLREGFVRAVRMLPPRYAEILRLYVRDGLSHDECAARLGIEVGAVKMRLCRARAEMRMLWNPPVEMIEGRRYLTEYELRRFHRR